MLESSYTINFLYKATVLKQVPSLLLRFLLPSCILLKVRIENERYNKTFLSSKVTEIY